MYFFKRRVQLFLPFFFTHHPLCNDFKQEIFSLGTWRICRGCTFVYSSAIVAFLFVVWLNPFTTFSVIEIFGLVMGNTSPTWLALFHKFKHRVLKDIARITLGIGWGMAIGEVILRPILLEKLFFLLSIGLIYLVFRTLKHRQAHKHPDQVCINCQESTRTSCVGTEQLLEAERTFSREYSDYLQQNLRWEDIQPHLSK